MNKKKSQNRCTQLLLVLLFVFCKYSLHEASSVVTLWLP